MAYHESRSKMVGRGPRGGRHTFNTARGTLKRPFCTLSGRLRISVPRKGTIQLTIGSLTGGGGNLQSRIRASVGHSHTEGQPLLCHTVPNMTCLPFVEGFKGCLMVLIDVAFTSFLLFAGKWECLLVYCCQMEGVKLRVKTMTLATGTVWLIDFVWSRASLVTHGPVR